MAKPICVIYFPDLYTSVDHDRNWIYEYARFLNGEQNDGGRYQWDGHFTDYYWFCFYKNDITEPEFKVFHEKDFTPIKYEELKQLVLDSIDKIKPLI